MIMPLAGSRTTGFRPFFNPATGEWIEYTAIAEDNHGQLVRFNRRSVPGGVITEHIHPGQEERFTIIAGEAHFTLNGEQRVAGAGETIVVPAGVLLLATAAAGFHDLAGIRRSRSPGPAWLSAKA